MEPITTAIVSRAIYDLLLVGISFTKDNIKKRLTEFITSDGHAELLAEKIEKLKVNDEMSEKAIEKHLKASPEVMNALANIPKTSIVSIQQTHNGAGDNIGRDKIINGKSE
ncbi:hypothetical protein PCO86_09260 [Pectobacteriaceae bacterium CE70]|uniref:GapS6a family protein n=1 Tax=Yersinia TaxID=629 RepID=UPI00263B9178|nr:hypothetical protein [Yersinia sp. 22-579]EKN6043298.1 hypothetical protein [Yersinia enterocolitica]WJV68551.1 hypothetical protein PCO86_09260 [Pectobacteriaceae bacterium CE70]WJY12482.1 hypothetical protein PCO80_09110 [Pectobacteriaceae bacterium C80]